MKTNQPNSNPIKILFADDHRAILETYSKYLEDSEDFVILKTVGTVREVLEQLQTNHFDVIILDLHLPQNRLNEDSYLKGYEVLDFITEHQIAILPIILSGNEAPTYIVNSRAKGAKGYLSKKVDAQEFREAIRTVAWKKEEYIEKNLLKKMVSTDDSDNVVINERERKLLKYIADGLTSREIANKMCLANHTIRDYRDTLMKKFGAKTAANLVMIATKHGYLTQT
jgi:DNA-binding NarL/FixJ family response regulator